MNAVRPLGAALIGIVLVALWLVLAPPIVSGWTDGESPVRGESMFTLAIFGPMLLVGIVGRRIGAVRGKLFGDDAGRATVLGIALGVGALLLAVGYTWLAGTLVGGASGLTSVTLVLGMLVIAVQVAAEELLFRGWLQPQIAAVIGTPGAVMLVAAVFAALHGLGGATGGLAVLNLMLGGMMFGLIAARSGGIAGAIAAHWGWNAGEQLLFGLDPNPGMGPFGAVRDLDLVGAIRWGGSDQGLNASFAMTAALAVIVVPLALRRGSTKTA